MSFLHDKVREGTAYQSLLTDLSHIYKFLMTMTIFDLENGKTEELAEMIKEKYLRNPL